MQRVEQTVGGYRGLQAEILVAIKKSQPVTVKELAELFSITRNGLRRHLKALESAGVVCYRRQIRGVGGPVFAYSLTDGADALFPHAYAPALTDALEVLRAEHGVEGVVSLFRRQWQATVTREQGRLATLPVRERATQLAQLRTSQGYMAEAEWSSPHEVTIREHNCAIREVAERFPEVCAAETEFFETMLGAAVQREAHILNGCNACEYRVQVPLGESRPTGGSSTGRPPRALRRSAQDYEE